MADTQRQADRPAWVRFAARAHTKRSTAVGQVGGFALLGGIGILVAGIESSSTSFLGGLAVPLGSAVAGLCVAAAVWSWLAMRWVDRHGRWT